MAVVLEWLGASYARLWRRRSCKSSAAAAAGEKKTEAKQMGCAAECGRALGRLRRALAWLCHAGQGVGDARPWLATTRRTGSEPVGHRAGRFSSFSEPKPSLTPSFHADATANPWLQLVTDLNNFCRPKYHYKSCSRHLFQFATETEKNRAQTSAVSLSVEKDLVKFAKC